MSSSQVSVKGITHGLSELAWTRRLSSFGTRLLQLEYRRESLQGLGETARSEPSLSGDSGSGRLEKLLQLLMVEQLCTSLSRGDSTKVRQTVAVARTLASMLPKLS